MGWGAHIQPIASHKQISVCDPGQSRCRAAKSDSEKDLEILRAKLPSWWSCKVKMFAKARRLREWLSACLQGGEALGYGLQLQDYSASEGRHQIRGQEGAPSKVRFAGEAWVAVWGGRTRHAFPVKSKNPNTTLSKPTLAPRVQTACAGQRTGQRHTPRMSP